MKAFLEFSSILGLFFLGVVAIVMIGMLVFAPIVGTYEPNRNVTQAVPTATAAPQKSEVETINYFIYLPRSWNDPDWKQSEVAIPAFTSEIYVTQGNYPVYVDGWAVPLNVTSETAGSTYYFATVERMVTNKQVKKFRYTPIVKIESLVNGQVLLEVYNLGLLERLKAIATATPIPQQF
jgi:hypothetical protein